MNSTASGKKLPFLGGGLFLAVVVLVLVAGFARHNIAIHSAPVSVATLTNALPGIPLPPGQPVFVRLPYEQAPDKFVTPADIKAIRDNMPKPRTFIWLYQPAGITIDSPTNARADFWRRRMPLTVEMTKQNGVWEVEDIRKGGQVCGAAPDWLDELSDKLPY
jgi:hypothetical protein